MFYSLVYMEKTFYAEITDIWWNACLECSVWWALTFVSPVSPPSKARCRACPSPQQLAPHPVLVRPSAPAPTAADFWRLLPWLPVLTLHTFVWGVILLHNKIFWYSSVIQSNTSRLFLSLLGNATLYECTRICLSALLPLDMGCF